MTHIVVVTGARGPEEVPGIDKLPPEIEVRFAASDEEVGPAMPGADILFGSSFKFAMAQRAWRAGDSLRWVHWCGAGIDSLMADDLIESDVVLTNSRGTVSHEMAEFTLGLVVAFAKRLPAILKDQSRHLWIHEYNQRLSGCSALVIGVGSIGREIGRLLGAIGLEVDGMGRSRRESDPDFRKIYAIGELDARLPYYDYVVVMAPSTPETYRLFGAKQFALMKPSARIINLARGVILDESALIDALNRGEIAGAGLDVFETEPLPADSPLWDMDNVIVSPHVSGEFEGYMPVVVDLFVENVKRYMSGEPLINLIDKKVGFFPGGS